MEPSGGGRRSLGTVLKLLLLAHQNRTIAIASDFRVDGAESPEIPQKEGALGQKLQIAKKLPLLADYFALFRTLRLLPFSGCLLDSPEIRVLRWAKSPIANR